MSQPRDDDPLTDAERHLIALLCQGPQLPQRLAETLGLTLEQTLHLLQRLHRTVGIVPFFRDDTLRYGLAE